MKGKKLTTKQENFVREYLVDLNATQAAIRAGYSKATAYSTGHENLKKPEIARRIKEVIDARQEKTEITAERVLKELANIAFSNVDDFFESVSYSDDEDEELAGKGRKYHQLKSDFLDSPRIAAVQSIEPGAYGAKLKMADKMKALEMISRHLGIFNADTSQKPENTNVVDLSGISSKKLRELQKVWNDDSEQ